MAAETHELQEKEAEVPEQVARPRSREVLSPGTDIFETDDAIMVAADMPGVKEEELDITLEKNQLAIRGKVSGDAPEEYRLTYQEYATGHYERHFILPNEVDQAQIEAALNDGVLKLRLPKGKEAALRKIPVEAG